MTNNNASDNRYRITEYLLHHGEGIQEHLRSLKLGLMPAYLEDEYNDAVVAEVVRLLTLDLGMNYVEVAEIVTKDFIVTLLNKEWLDL